MRTGARPPRIEGFIGPYRFLSNFHPAPVKLGAVAGVDGPATFPTVEHAYQACKTNDPRERAWFLLAATPGDAKRLGELVTSRTDWDQVRLTVMAALLKQKFSHPHLAEKLAGTGDAVLVELNTWGDRFWGVCGNRGDNNLGLLLMETRRWVRQRQHGQRAAE